MLDIEKKFCECYSLEERAITDTECLKLIELLLKHFYRISFTNVEADGFLPYNIMSETITEEFDLVGSGDDIKSVVLKQCTNRKAYENEEFKKDVHITFIKFPQRFKEAIDEAFSEVLHKV